MSRVAASGRVAVPLAQNLLTYSSTFDHSPWGTTNASVTANAATDPLGGNTAYKLVGNTTLSPHTAYETVFGRIVGQMYTASIYAKAAEDGYLLILEGSSSTVAAWFNLSAGTLGNVSGNGSPAPTSSIVSVGSGWYRCSVTYQNLGSNPNAQYGATTGNGTYNYVGDGTSGIYVWGAQYEQALTGPYLATTASASSGGPHRTAASARSAASGRGVV